MWAADFAFFQSVVALYFFLLGNCTVLTVCPGETVFSLQKKAVAIVSSTNYFNHCRPLFTNFLTSMNLFKGCLESKARFICRAKYLLTVLSFHSIKSLHLAQVCQSQTTENSRNIVLAGSVLFLSISWEKES